MPIALRFSFRFHAQSSLMHSLAGLTSCRWPPVRVLGQGFDLILKIKFDSPPNRIQST